MALEQLAGTQKAACRAWLDGPWQAAPPTPRGRPGDCVPPRNRPSLAETAAGRRRGSARSEQEGPPPPLVSSALGRSGLLRAARAGPLRGGGASAGAPDGRAPKTTARGGACARGQGRGDAEQAGADGDGARRLTWLGP